MKIGLICPYDVFKGGGVAEQVIALQAEYAKMGHQAKILTPLPRGYKGSVPEHVILLGVSSSVKAFFHTNGQWSLSVDTDDIDEVYEREKFDILHFHEPHVPLWGRQLLMRSNSVNVATMHAKLPDTITTKTLVNVVTPYTKPMLKYFDAFTAVSTAATEYLLSLEKVPITIVPNGVDVAKYRKKPKKLPAKTSKKTILYVGRLEKRKGLRYLLKAYQELSERRNDVRLLLAGTGPEEESLRNFVAIQEISGVKFLGYISDEEKIRHLHSADVFCAPSHYGESFGVVLLEAMAAGCPLVAGDNPGYLGVMQGFGSISMVNSQDSIDFARRLDLMINEPDMRKLWKRWASNYIGQYDYRIVAKKYLDVYEKAMKSHAKTRQNS
jgi:phosphatidylinositol alpha-mannosyltransferase